jgi:TldD protein
VEDKADAIARVLWLNTDKMYKHAAQTYLEVKTNTKVRADEDDNSADFTTEKAQSYTGPAVPQPRFDQKDWEGKVRKLSAIFTKYPDIENSTVMLVVQTGTLYLVSSDGPKIVE